VRSVGDGSYAQHGWPRQTYAVSKMLETMYAVPPKFSVCSNNGNETAEDGKIHYRNSGFLEGLKCSYERVET